MRRFFVGLEKYSLGFIVSSIILFTLEEFGHPIMDTNPFFSMVTWFYVIPYNFKQLITKSKVRKYENLEANLGFMFIYFVCTLFFSRSLVCILISLATFVLSIVVLKKTEMPIGLKEKREFEAENKKKEKEAELEKRKIEVKNREELRKLNTKKDSLNKQLNVEMDKNIIKLPLGVKIDLIHKSVVINGMSLSLNSIIDMNILEDTEVTESSITNGNATTKGKSHRSLGSALVRGTVGTVLFPGVGTVIGVATAKKKHKSNTNTTAKTINVSKTIHDYTLEIFTSNVTNSVVVLKASNRTNPNARNDIMNVYYGILNSENIESKSSNEEVIKELEDKIEEVNREIKALGY